jgi:malate dehydrogenase (quinone)
MSNSGVFNSAGTGHEANCKLNYTPVDEEETEVEEALHIKKRCPIYLI